MTDGLLPQRRALLVTEDLRSQRRALLVAALGFMRLHWREPVPPAVLVLTRWMNS